MSTPLDEWIAFYLGRNVVVSAYKATVRATGDESVSLQPPWSEIPTIPKFSRPRLNERMLGYPRDWDENLMWKDPDLSLMSLENRWRWYTYYRPINAVIQRLAIKIIAAQPLPMVDCEISTPPEIFPPSRLLFRFTWPKTGRRGLRYASILTGNYRSPIYKETSEPNIAHATHVWWHPNNVEVWDIKRYVGHLNIEWVGLEVGDYVGNGREMEIWVWNDKRELSYAIKYWVSWDSQGNITYSRVSWKDAWQPKYPYDVKRYGRDSIEGPIWGDEFICDKNGIRFETMEYTPNNTISPVRFWRGVIDTRWRETGEERRKQELMPLLGLSEGDLATPSAFHAWVKRQLDAAPFPYPKVKKVQQALQPLNDLVAFLKGI